MHLVVHALDREIAARLRDLAEGWLGEGAPRAELAVSHRRLDGDARGEHEVRLTLHRPYARVLHVVAREHEPEQAARAAVVELGQALAREAVRVRRVVISRATLEPSRSRRARGGDRGAQTVAPDVQVGDTPVDRGPGWGFKPRHGPL